MGLKEIAALTLLTLFSKAFATPDSLEYNFKADGITGKCFYRNSSYKLEAKISPSGFSKVWWFLINRNYRTYEAKDTIYYFENDKQYKFDKSKEHKNVLMAIRDLLYCINKGKLEDYPLAKEGSMKVFVDGKDQKVKLESLEKVTLELDSTATKKADSARVEAIEGMVIGVPDKNTKFKIYIVENKIPYLQGDFYFRVPILNFIKIHGTLEAWPPEIRGARVIKHEESEESADKK